MKPQYLNNLNCIRAFVLVVLFTLTGCQTLHTATALEQTNNFPKSKELSSYEPITTSGMILLAEYNFAHDDTESALAVYRKVAFLSENPEVTKRAVILARQSGAVEDSRVLLKRWRKLAPHSVDSLEAQLIFEAHHGKKETIKKILDELLSKDANYNYFWISSFWTGLKDERKVDLLNALLLCANGNNNDSLAMIVTEIQNRQLKESGTEWLDQWMENRNLTEGILLFRARLDLPDFKRAIQRLEQDINLKDALDIKAQLARWYGLSHELDRARILLDEVIEKDKSRFPDILTLGLLEKQSNRFDAAETQLKKLLAKEQFRADAYYHLGEIAKKTDRPELAIDRFLRVDRGELIIEARKQAGEIAIQQSRPSDSERWFNEARLLYPHLKKELWLGEAQIHTENQSTGVAIRILNEALETMPDTIELLYMRALTFEQLNRIDAAESDLRMILAQNPTDPDALNALGYTLADRTNRFDEALELIAQALEAKPDSPAILDSMGWVLYKLGQHKKALTYFEQAWNLIQDHEIAAHYGEVLWIIGKREKARKIWERGYESKPESEIIRATINRLQDS